ncbi:MAG: FeoB-associated Cys-rich membrane protein [Parabacteroides sp.]|nr:FeoB-associated Cys-rich membrane protein [Parabacteroides sp.]
MWQEIAVLIIGLIVILYIGWKLYRLLAHPTGTDNPCHGCPGCALKDKANAPDFHPKRKKAQ